MGEPARLLANPGAGVVVRWTGRLAAWWNARSLAAQFLLAGGLASFIVMALVGAVVTSVIEEGVLRNSAAATALYVDSVIAPILPDMQKAEVLDDTVTRALDETLGQGALGKRLVSFRLWRRDGSILYSNRKDQVGSRFEPNPELRRAFTGQLVAEYDRVDDPESQAERALGQPLLEVYTPIRQPWSGEVVAVSEFYEVATDIENGLFWARVSSLAAVAAATLAFFLLLSAIVLRGSRTIETQSGLLRQRVRELSRLLEQNDSLRERVQRASQQVVTLNEANLRRIGSDLHDGPAQLIALASMKLDAALPDTPASSSAPRAETIRSIKASLDDALDEIRGICKGLILPEIEALSVPELVARAVRAHEQRTGSKVEVSLCDRPVPVPPSGKICIYRFVQEALSNAWRHANGTGQSVRCNCGPGRVLVEVSDRGPGFDPQHTRLEGLGLSGLRERVESLGGVFTVETSDGGTTLKMALDLEGHRLWRKQFALQ